MATAEQAGNEAARDYKNSEEAQQAKDLSAILPVAPAASEKTTQEITDIEKLGLREIENEYLKAQVQLTSLNNITHNAQKKFTSTVEGLLNKYALDADKFQFDNLALKFVRK
jgi:hypothetical protein